MKKVKLAYRFGDLDSVKEFIEVNKLPYDEIIVLFDTMIEDKQEQPEEIPAKEIDKDELITKLMKENEEYRVKKKEIPIPTPPTTKKDNMRIIAI
jgi:hypothetical protein